MTTTNIAELEARIEVLESLLSASEQMRQDMLTALGNLVFAIDMELDCQQPIAPIREPLRQAQDALAKAEGNT